MQPVHRSVAGSEALSSKHSVATRAGVSINIQSFIHSFSCDSRWGVVKHSIIHSFIQLRSPWKEGRKCLFNDTLNTFYLQLYGIGHMVKHSDRASTLDVIGHQIDPSRTH